MHEFVNSDGLSALISVGQDADQNYQNYILRGREITSLFIAEFMRAQFSVDHQNMVVEVCSC